MQDDSSPYGFAGEWWQDNVELLHLRARWYSPETGTFLSVDPIEDNQPYLYVGGNPILYIDPSGFQEGCPIGVPDCNNYDPNYGWKDAAYCRRMSSKQAYKDCIAGVYDIIPLERTLTQFEMENITGVPGCDLWGPIEYFAPGFAEGVSVDGAGLNGGREVVYDFATMERQKFFYGGFGPNSDFGLTTNLSNYQVLITGFKSNSNIREDYRGPFIGGGLSKPLPIPQTFGVLSGGPVYFQSPNGQIKGIGLSLGAGLDWTKVADVFKKIKDNINFVLPHKLSAAGAATYYYPDGNIYPYTKSEEGERTRVKRRELIGDILYGTDSPIDTQSTLSLDDGMEDTTGAPPVHTWPLRAIMVPFVFQYANTYDDLYFGPPD